MENVDIVLGIIASLLSIGAIVFSKKLLTERKKLKKLSNKN